MWYRRLRALDTDLSAVGFGGIVLTRRPQDECNRHVAEVIDAGITYFDVGVDDLGNTATPRNSWARLSSPTATCRLHSSCGRRVRTIPPNP
ncbi:MAG: hypothetical protein AAF663_08170, partial [Planctomycetota bacterium]